MRVLPLMLISAEFDGRVIAGRRRVFSSCLFFRVSLFLRLHDSDARQLPQCLVTIARGARHFTAVC